MSIVDDNGVAEFPAGLKVLIVDDDKTCLLVLERMLRKLLYQVTKCEHGSDALALLREKNNRFDIVICDLHMPDIHGLELIEIIVSEMDLPVVMMSSDERQGVIMKGIVKGACDFLVKPVRMESISLIWQHVVRKKIRLFAEFQQPGIDNINFDRLSLLQLSNDASATANRNIPAIDKRSLQCLKRRSEDSSNDGESSDEATNWKKPRVVWTQELHELFVTAVNQLGHGDDVPKKILERMQAMNVTYLTRANIASHLQKYRMHLQKESARSAGNRDLNAYQQFHPTPTPTAASSYPLPQENLANGDVLSTVPSQVDRGNNIFDLNIVSQLSHGLQTDASLYYPCRPNSLYHNDFPPSDGVVISKEENLQCTAGTVTELSNPFSAADEIIYDPSFLQEEVALVGLQPNMGGYLPRSSNYFGLTQS
ncbi:two-component response regulator ORR21-like [Hibiscus syriacus]|uniref:two-component response regulator ORR21-like n=1 Tax=Hibiscus syriacus TaxID=106335 RepID=UPI00192423D5|nr:two-component response regulator ORR21-like [Hibiscus syriacus]